MLIERKMLMNSNYFVVDMKSIDLIDLSHRLTSHHCHTEGNVISRISRNYGLEKIISKLLVADINSYRLIEVLEFDLKWS